MLNSNDLIQLNFFISNSFCTVNIFPFSGHVHRTSIIVALLLHSVKGIFHMFFIFLHKFSHFLHKMHIVYAKIPHLRQNHRKILHFHAGITFVTRIPSFHFVLQINTVPLQFFIVYYNDLSTTYAAVRWSTIRQDSICTLRAWMRAQKFFQGFCFCYGDITRRNRLFSRSPPCAWNKPAPAFPPPGGGL